MGHKAAQDLWVHWRLLLLVRWKVYRKMSICVMQSRGNQDGFVTVLECTTASNAMI